MKFIIDDGVNDQLPYLNSPFKRNLFRVEESSIERQPIVLYRRQNRLPDLIDVVAKRNPVLDQGRLLEILLGDASARVENGNWMRRHQLLNMVGCRVEQRSLFRVCNEIHHNERRARRCRWTCDSPLFERTRESATESRTQ